MPKKLCLCLLILALLLTCFSALADVKNADITIGGPSSNLPETVRSLAATNDTLYMLTQNNGLYAFSKQTGETAPLALEGIRAPIAADGETLYSLDMASGLLSPIEGESIQLDWSVFKSEEPYAYQAHTAFFMDGLFYVQTGCADTDDWRLRALYRFNLETGAGEWLYTGRDMPGICAYKDGKLLMLRIDEDKYYASAMPNPADAPSIQVFNPNTKAFEETLHFIQGYGFGGLAYSAEKDTLYLSTGDGVMQKRGNAAFEQLTYLPVSHVVTDARAILLGNSHYALFGSSTVYIRSLDPNDKPAYTLKVQNTHFENEGREGYLAFTKKYPDVTVVCDDNGIYTLAEDIYQDMQRKDAADIYMLYYLGELESLINKGYCVDLTDNSVIASTVDAMYPHMTASVFNAGKVYGVPYRSYLPGIWAYSPSVLKALNLAEADLPTNLSEFMDFIIAWAEDYSLNYPDINLVDHQYFKWRNKLMGMIFENQIAYCHAQGIPITFETPELLELLNKLDAMTDIFKDLDPTDAELENGMSWSSEDPLESLFLFDYEMLSTERMNVQECVPLQMNYIGDVPMVNPLDMEVLVVNPYSKNRDMAVKFLEEMAANLDPKVKIILTPGADEPVENADYETTIASFEEHIGLLKANFEKAPEHEKKNFETEIEDYQRRFDWVKENSRYTVTKENIEAYRDMAQTFIPMEGGVSIFFGSPNLRTAYERYFKQQMNAEQYIIETEKILKKMHNENQ